MEGTVTSIFESFQVDLAQEQDKREVSVYIITYYYLFLVLNS